jgi:exonuclease SbcD
MPSRPAGSYRILHTSDWHLGKLLNDRSREEEQARVRAWLLGAVAEEGVDAVVVAGDVFDAANPPQSAVQMYYDFASQLYRQGGCALVVVAGNHDSPTHLESPREVLRVLGAHVFGALAEDAGERLLLLPDADAPRVALAAVPFLRDRDLRRGVAGETERDIRRALRLGIETRYAETADALRVRAPGVPAVATGHLAIDGASTSDSERDIHIGGLGAVATDVFPTDFAYVALGHLHRPQAASSDGRVRYSGSPFPLSFGEWKDTKSVQLIDVSTEGVTATTLPIPVARRLEQVRLRAVEIETTLGGFAPERAELPTWVEVVVEDAALEADVSERVRAAVEGKHFEVLKVVRAGVAGTTIGAAEDRTDEEVIDALLLDPAAVFQQEMDRFEQFDDEERKALNRAFAELLEGVESEREGASS